MRQKSTATRLRILETVSALFYREGIRAIGVDTIVEQSGISKMTLYRYFSSKDDLLIAYLDQANEYFWGWFDAAVALYPEAPREQLVAVFETLTQQLSVDVPYGCPFINAGIEFPDFSHRVHQAAQAHKEAVRERLQGMTQAAGARTPGVLADQLLLLMDGAYVEARIVGGSSPAAHMTEAAVVLIDTQLASG